MDTGGHSGINMMADTPLLSVSMIVKNEAHQIEKILSQCKSFADEIIVVDTGSADNTKEVAMSYTDRVYDFKWCDDFSAARNISIDKATGKYIVILDADDRVDEQNQERFNKLKKYLDGERVFLFRVNNVEENGNRNGNGFYQIRCFPNRPDVRYEGRIHNQIAPSIEKARLKLVHTDLEIKHIGYEDPNLYSDKAERTFNILLKEYEEKPFDGRVNIYLGLKYEEKGEYDLAKKHYETAVEAFEPNLDKKPWGMYESLCGLVRVNYRLGDKKKAKEYFRKLSLFTIDAPRQVALNVTTLAEDFGFYDNTKVDIGIDKLDFLIVARNDWANVGYDLSKSMEAVGLKAVALTLNSHPFEYENQAKKVNSIAETSKYAKVADRIIFMHSEYIETGVDTRNKKLSVFHGGTAYRNYHYAINKALNDRLELSLIQTLDLWGKGAKNEKWLLPPVDTDRIKPVVYRENPRLVIGHFPSSHAARTVKGTYKLEEAVERLKQDPDIAGKFECIITTEEQVSWEENLRRMADCDVYADQFELGIWGVSTLEAAALGKIVLTCFDGIDRYKEEYGECPLVIAKTVDEIESALRRLILMSEDERRDLKAYTRHWVVVNHSYKPTGERIKSIYGL